MLLKRRQGMAIVNFIRDFYSILKPFEGAA